MGKDICEIWMARFRCRGFSVAGEQGEDKTWQLSQLKNVYFPLPTAILDILAEEIVRQCRYLVPLQEWTRKPQISCFIAEKCVLPVTSRHIGSWGIANCRASSVLRCLQERVRTLAPSGWNFSNIVFLCWETRHYFVYHLTFKHAISISRIGKSLLLIAKFLLQLWDNSPMRFAKFRPVSELSWRSWHEVNLPSLSCTIRAKNKTIGWITILKNFCSMV
jgi:hypothetical protein